MNWLKKIVMIFKKKSKCKKENQKSPAFELDILKNKNPSMLVFGSPGCGMRRSIIIPEVEKNIILQSKEKTKEILCKAIDNIPECAGIVDCYTEHSFMSDEAYIKIKIKVIKPTDEKVIEFHNVAHDSFGTGMDFIS